MIVASQKPAQPALASISQPSQQTRQHQPASASQRKTSPASKLASISQPNQHQPATK